MRTPAVCYTFLVNRSTAKQTVKKQALPDTQPHFLRHPGAHRIARSAAVGTGAVFLALLWVTIIVQQELLAHLRNHLSLLETRMAVLSE